MAKLSYHEVIAELEHPLIGTLLGYRTRSKMLKALRELQAGGFFQRRVVPTRQGRSVIWHELYNNTADRVPGISSKCWQVLNERGWLRQELGQWGTISVLTRYYLRPPEREYSANDEAWRNELVLFDAVMAQVVPSGQ